MSACSKTLRQTGSLNCRLPTYELMEEDADIEPHWQKVKITLRATCEEVVGPRRNHEKEWTHLFYFSLWRWTIGATDGNMKISSKLSATGDWEPIAQSL